MVKEYGGYLPLELSKGRPYYTGEDVILRYRRCRLEEDLSSLLAL